jgi:MFS family permease
MPFAAFCGIPPLPTATAYGLLSLLNLGGMVLAGWLADRIDRVALLAGIYFIRGLTFLLLIGVGTNYQTLLIFAVIFGIVDYSTVPVTVSLCASHLDRRILGFAFGLISGGHSVGAALGAILGGAIFSSTAGYGLMWLTGTWAALGAAVLVLGIYRTRPTAGLPT